jgi:hypothetical protein
MSDENQQLMAMLEGLSPAQATRMMTCTTAIALEAQKRFGVAPAMGDVLSLAQVKATTLEGYEPDIENALYQLRTEAPSMLAALAAKEEAKAADAAVLEAGETPSGITAEQIEGMPPHLQDYVRPGMSYKALAALPPQLRMTISRSLDLTKEQRNPTQLTAAEVRDTTATAPAAEAKDLRTRNAVPVYRQINDAAAKMDAARKAAQ